MLHPSAKTREGAEEPLIRQLALKIRKQGFYFVAERAVLVTRSTNLRGDGRRASDGRKAGRETRQPRSAEPATAESGLGTIIEGIHSMTRLLGMNSVTRGAIEGAL